MSDASKLISRLCLWIAGAALLLMTGIIIWQVFARYVLNDSPSWTEQGALYLMVWTVFLGAAAGVREQFHIQITLLADAVSGRRKRIVLAATHLVTLLLGGVLAFYGIALVIALWGFTIPTLGLPRGSALLPIPISGLLMAGFSIEHLIALFKDQNVEATWN